MNVLVRPIKTEKSMKVAELRNSFTFEVPTFATKHQIKKAVEDNFKVKVIAVRTVHNIGKTKRIKRKLQRLADSKKAIVAVEGGQTIPFFGIEKKGKKKKEK